MTSYSCWSSVPTELDPPLQSPRERLADYYLQDALKATSTEVSNSRPCKAPAETRAPFRRRQSL